MGRNELLSDSQTLIAADQAYLESGGSFNAVIVSLLTSDSFMYRKVTNEQVEEILSYPPLWELVRFARLGFQSAFAKSRALANRRFALSS